MSSSSRRSSSKRARDQQPQQQQHEADGSKHAHAAATAASSSPSSPPPARRARLLGASADATAAASVNAESDARASAALSDDQRGQPMDAASHTCAPAERAGVVDDVSSCDAAAASTREVYAAPSLAASPPVADKRAHRGAAAASSAFVRPSPAARLDLDSLSVCFSFLNTADFLAAIRVCRQWRAARMRHSAWPTFQLQPFIQSFKNDSHKDPGRRSLRLNIRDGNIAQLCALLIGNHSAPSAYGDDIGEVMWKHVSEVDVTHAGLSERPPGMSIATLQRQQRRACDAMLLRLSELPFLRALKISNFDASASLAEELFRASHKRLRAIQINSSVGFATKLHLLSNLRVLVVQGFMNATALLALHRLEFVRLVSCFYRGGTTVGSALRELTTEHRLTRVSLGVGTRLILPGLLQARIPAADFVDAGQLRELRVEDDVTPDQLRSILALPSLTGLHIRVPTLAGEPLPDAALANLRQLRLSWLHPCYGAPMLAWHHLLRTHQLVELHLESCDVSRDWASQLQRVLDANRDCIEELCLHPLVDAHREESAEVSDRQYTAYTDGDGASTLSPEWRVITLCAKLREVEISMRNVSPSLLDALSRAPAFLSLTLTEVQPALLTSALQVMVSSRSWCTLRLCGSELLLHAIDLEALLQAAGVDAQAARRMRVSVHGGGGLPEHAAFGIRADESGVQTWQQL